jgi:Sugar transferases involved in lipopolysaccharide synthesis
MTTSSPATAEPNTETRNRLAYLAGKRTLDACCSAIGLIVLLPFIAAVAIAVRLSSPGPAIYRGPRVGLNGVPFYIFKFRTMFENADRVGGSCTADDDARITKVGRWLRKTKIDELPQLFNVLLGDMALVGPRPELEQFTSTYSARERQVLTVKPGITDLATLWDSDEGAVLAGESDPERAYRAKILPTKLQLQLEYVENASFLLDLRILIRTVAACVHAGVRLHRETVINHVEHRRNFRKTGGGRRKSCPDHLAAALACFWR